MQTVPNGYTMAIEGHRMEYMYYSPEQLLEGVMMHIGLKMTDQLNMDNVKDFLSVVLEWHDAEKRIKEIHNLKAQLRAMASKRNGLARRLIDERRECISLRNDLSIIKEAAQPSVDDMVKELSATILKKHREQKPLTMDSLGVTIDQITDDEPDEEELDDEETAEPATDGE